MKKNKIKPPFKSHNHKFHICEWILEHFPDNCSEMFYVEPFCGTASVLLNKPQSKEEAINDIDTELTEILRAIRDNSKELISRLKKIKHSKETFEEALLKKEFHEEMDVITNAFLLRKLSVNGAKQEYSPTKNENNWKNMLENLVLLSKRLEKVYIFNVEAIDVIKAFNEENTLMYLDPPEDYDHLIVAEKVKDFKGKIVFSTDCSYVNRGILKGWKSDKLVIDDKKEVIWINY